MKLVDPIGLVLERKGREIWRLPPTASVFEAIEAMAERHVGALLVMAGERLLGVVSERDYARKVFLLGRSSKETRVDEIMTSPVITARPAQTVEECLGLMTRRRVRHLPVVEGERVVGVLSMGDLVKWVISAQAEIIHELEDYIAGKYPA